MKRILITLALALVVVPFAAAQAAFEADKVLVEFTAGTDVKNEINLANAVLTAQGATALLEDEFKTSGTVTELELTADNAAEITYLVSTYFPGRSTVLSANFEYEDDAASEVDDVDGADDSVSGGANSLMFVHLNMPAPANGAWVKLTSSSANVRVPTAVFVPAGKTKASFFARTNVVLKTTRVRIAGTYKGRIMSSMLTVKKA